MVYRDLLEYNAWANTAVLSVLDRLSEEELKREMPELGGSTLNLLEHIQAVEANFLATINGQPRPPRGNAPTYHDIRAMLCETDAAYLAQVDSLAARQHDSFEVAWFQRSFEVGQALVQVVTHSIQHRAALCAGIALAGWDAPGLDYIHWLSEFR